jgi:DNA-binding response OmpR family regulator
MTEKDFINEMQEFLPDLIRSDYALTKYNGVLDLAKARRRCLGIPFILVTAAVSEDRSIENTRKRHGWKSRRRH